MKKVILATAIVVSAAATAQPYVGDLGEVYDATYYGSASDLFMVFNWNPEVYQDDCVATVTNADYPYEILAEEAAHFPPASNGLTNVRWITGEYSHENSSKAKSVRIECTKNDGSPIAQTIRIPAPPKIDVSNLSVNNGQIQGSVYVEGNAPHTYCEDETANMPWGNPNVFPEVFAKQQNFYSAYMPINTSYQSYLAGVNQFRVSCQSQGGKTTLYFELYSDSTKPVHVQPSYRQ